MRYFQKLCDQVADLASAGPFLLLPVGAPGSGKSTFVTELQQVLPDVVVVSRDAVVLDYALADGISYAEAYVKYKAETDIRYSAHLADVLASQHSVIVDRTNLLVAERAAVLTQNSLFRRAIAVSFELPRTELLRRLDRRAHETGKVIPPFVVDAKLAEFTAPGREEGFTHVLAAYPCPVMPQTSFYP